MADQGVMPGAPDDHAAHDPELIAGLLDRDLAAAGRAAAEARVAACPACKALRDDLFALSAATRALGAPSRPRDFALRLEALDARRIPARVEPIPAGSRLIGEMPDTRTSHAAHDRLLVATLLDRSLDPAERTKGEALVATCAECARLHVDLVALSVATRELPFPARPRDFTLSAADADRLRIRGWRRLIAAIGSTRDSFSRPLAIGLTTLGLAGLLVGTVPWSFGGAAGSGDAAVTEAARNAAGAGLASAAPESLALGSAAPYAPTASGPAMAATAPTASPPPGAVPAPTNQVEAGQPDGLFEGGESSPLAGEPAGRGGVDLFKDSLADDRGGPSTMIVVATGLLLAGLGLFLLRWTARRFGDG